LAVTDNFLLVDFKLRTFMLKVQYSLPLLYLSDESYPLLDVNHRLWSAYKLRVVAQTINICGPEVLFETCVAIKFVDDDDDLLDDGSFIVPQVPNMLHFVYHYAFFRRSLFNFCCGTR